MAGLLEDQEDIGYGRGGFSWLLYGLEISINELVETVVRLTGFDGQIARDKMKPNYGQPRRKRDTRRSEQESGFRSKVPIEERLRRTIDWHKSALGLIRINVNTFNEFWRRRFFQATVDSAQLTADGSVASHSRLFNLSQLLQLIRS